MTQAYFFRRITACYKPYQTTDLSQINKRICKLRAADDRNVLFLILYASTRWRNTSHILLMKDLVNVQIANYT